MKKIILLLTIVIALSACSNTNNNKGTEKLLKGTFWKSNAGNIYVDFKTDMTGVFIVEESKHIANILYKIIDKNRILLLNYTHKKNDNDSDTSLKWENSALMLELKDSTLVAESYGVSFKRSLENRSEVYDIHDSRIFDKINVKNPLKGTSWEAVDKNKKVKKINLVDDFKATYEDVNGRQKQCYYFVVNDYILLCFRKDYPDYSVTPYKIEGSNLKDDSNSICFKKLN